MLINELLCFSLNKYGKVPQKSLKDVVIKFYNDEEILAAKEVMFNELSKLNLDSLGRWRPRQGDNRGIRNVEDILEYITRADEAGVLSSLPTFVAAKTDRIPTLQPEEMDLCAILRKVAQLEERVSQHDKLIHSQSHLGREDERQTSDDTAAGASVGLEVSAVTPHGSSTSWAGTVAATANDEREWIQVSRQKPGQALPVRVRGTKSTTGGGTAIQTVPRRLTAFVSRLALDTTSDDLHDFLTEAGLKDVQCTKMKSKDGKVFRSAAFRVSCSDVSRDLFYNENIWPDGCLLRDWYFTNRNSNADQAQADSH